MKNIFALLLLSLLTMNTLKAQDELKDWRFGLKFAPSLSWLTPQDEKRLTNEGVGFGYEWGIDVGAQIEQQHPIAYWIFPFS